jgi:hypothetical protein
MYILVKSKGDMIFLRFIALLFTLRVLTGKQTVAEHVKKFSASYKNLEFRKKT